MRVDLREDVIDITKDSRTIRIPADVILYLRDIAMEFDAYYSAVVPVDELIDYSTPKLHDVVGFGRPLMLSSFIELLADTKQYTDLAKLKPGDIALDLGACFGITAILFKKIVGTFGRVIAVEADTQKTECIEYNIDGLEIELLKGAVWSHNNGIEFSSDGTMGSGAVGMIGKRGEVINVPSYTLSAIVDKFDLSRVDFIKCDIEGAEAVVFGDRNFFRRFAPRIIIESHRTEATIRIKKYMKAYGYTITEVSQKNCRFPLLQCVPTGDNK